jgi:pimeloyl-ACP methyl ester carboxylesterase
MPALAQAGFHVVAPDMRGFGRSSAPSDITAYSIFRINELERVLPNLKARLIDGAGHWIQQERPDEVNAALISFLNENVV